MTSDALIGIGDAARALSTTPRTLRYYEQRGLLEPSEISQAGHRRYGPESLRRARRVLRLRGLGLSLDDIAAALSGDESQLGEILTAQAAFLDTHLAELETLRHRLGTLLARDTPNPLAGAAERFDESIDLLEELAMTIVLSRIYTRTGDHGTTTLANEVRVEKTDPLLEVIGDLDELTTALGLAVAASTDASRTQVGELRVIQNELFNLGADLAHVDGDRSLPPTRALIDEANIRRLEQLCDKLNADLIAPDSFVLPGGDPLSAALHHARAICRRAERHCWAVTTSNPAAAPYLNRLSDLLFILARSAEGGGEPTWATS